MSKRRIDLAYGNPGFIQDIWSDEIQPIHYHKTAQMPYLLGKTILPALEDNIIKIHKKYKNCKITENSHIIVTVGAVQALLAAMYALKIKDVNNTLEIPIPYWGRFNTFADNLGYFINSPKDDETNTVRLITTPNNPDGNLNNQLKADIRDACYNWPHYTKKPILLDDPITIFSLSKLSGHSSTRIGWAVVQDKDIADKMQEYVELFSSGVSIESQSSAADILETLNDKDDYILQLAKKELDYRNKRIRQIVSKYSLPIKLLSQEGMFLYIQSRPQFIHDLHIQCFEGSNFSDPAQNGLHKYRFNIGTNAYDFYEFLDRMIEIGKTYKSESKL